MSNKEILGVSAVERLVSRTDYLEPFINRNDREPSWDGFINVYNHAGNHSKHDMVGRVYVQVKGHGCEDVDVVRKSFAVDMADLRNYLQEGGTIFFVVYITDKEEIVYYNSLLPYELKEIINKYSKQNSYSIRLKPFPQNP